MKAKKFFAVVTLLIISTFLLSGCNYSTGTTEAVEWEAASTATVVPTQAPPKIGTFVAINSEKIYDNFFQIIMYDPETMVMWSVISTGYYEGGISQSPMYNADGTLRIYNPNGE